MLVYSTNKVLWTGYPADRTGGVLPPYQRARELAIHDFVRRQHADALYGTDGPVDGTISTGMSPLHLIVASFLFLPYRPVLIQILKKYQITSLLKKDCFNFSYLTSIISFGLPIKFFAKMYT
jgi:hypothetical protein